jgi:hypothetical protein
MKAPAKPRRKAPPRLVVLQLSHDQAAAVMTACATYANDDGAVLGEHARVVHDEIERQLFGAGKGEGRRG